MSDEFVDAADEAGDAIDRFRFAFTNLKVRVVGAILPTLTKVTTWLAHAVAYFGRLVDKTNAIKAALLVLGGGGVLLAVAKLAKIFGIADTGAFGFLKTLLKMGPIALLAAALFLAFEDIYTLMTGGDSLIGRFLGGSGSAQLVATLQKAFNEIGETLKGMLPVLADLGLVLLKAFVDALPAIVTVLSVMTKGFAAALDLFSGFVKAVGKAADGDWSGVGKEIDKAGDKVFGKGGIFAGAEHADRRDLREGIRRARGRRKGVAQAAGRRRALPGRHVVSLVHEPAPRVVRDADRRRLGAGLRRDHAQLQAGADRRHEARQRPGDGAAPWPEGQAERPQGPDPARA
jgi:hypothetical protein